MNYDGPIAGRGTAAQRLMPTPVVTGGYQARAGDLAVCDATAASFTVTLPPISVAGDTIAVRLLATASGHTVTVVPSGTDVIDVSTPSTVLQLAGEAVTVASDGDGPRGLTPTRARGRWRTPVRCWPRPESIS